MSVYLGRGDVEIPYMKYGVKSPQRLARNFPNGRENTPPQLERDKALLVYPSTLSLTHPRSGGNPFHPMTECIIRDSIKLSADIEKA
ncbi:hypothetical protein SESBI_51127 [Sesbania bispinosa]|nr:hypothetical protein SESBI_51127 [Sesbania bispinosa]